MNGDVDVIDKVDPKTVALLARVPTLDILEVAGTLHYTMPMRVDAAPFDNLDLRLALKHSIKRQELVDKILLGHGVVGNDHPISTANPYHAGDLAQREFDPEKAAMHYKKSGHSGKIQLSASDAAFAGAVDAAQLVAASAKEVGIDIEVVREPSDGYWSNARLGKIHRMLSVSMKSLKRLVLSWMRRSVHQCTLKRSSLSIMMVALLFLCLPTISMRFLRKLLTVSRLLVTGNLMVIRLMRDGGLLNPFGLVPH